MATNSKYKLLLLDLDGTTVESRQYAMPSKRVAEAVKSAQKFIKVSVATGRGYSFANDVINELGLSGVGVFSGGAEIIQMDNGKIIKQQFLSVKKMREIVTMLLPFGHVLLSDLHNYEKRISSGDDLYAPAAKILVQDVSFTDAQNILQELSGLLGISVHLSTSWNNDNLTCIEIAHENATKRHGVEILLSMLGYEKDQVIAIGDGYNDAPLLEAAGLKIVMGNAPDELKPLADYIAPPIAEDGVAVAIEKFILA